MAISAPGTPGSQSQKGNHLSGEAIPEIDLTTLVAELVQLKDETKSLKESTAQINTVMMTGFIVLILSALSMWAAAMYNKEQSYIRLMEKMYEIEYRNGMISTSTDTLYEGKIR